MAIHGYQYLIFEWCMVVITALFVSLRLYVQTNLSRTSLSLPPTIRIALEGLVIFAWVHFLGQAILDSLLLKNHGLGSEVGNLAPGVELRQTRETALKIMFVANTIYLNSMYAIKTHMLLFYWTSLNAAMRAKRKTFFCLQFATVFVIVAWVSEFFLNLLFCHPISDNWSLDDEKFCSALANEYVYGFICASHVASDLMVYFLPVPILITIQFADTRKQLLAFLSFGFGFFSVSFAVAQFVTNLFPGVDITTNYMFTAMEQTWAMLVVCVPAFKLFMRGWQYRIRVSEITHVISLQSDENSGNGLSDMERVDVHEASNAKVAV